MQKNDVGYLLKHINDKLTAKADSELKKFNLTMSQSRVLIFLSRHGGHATQKEIEVFLQVAHPTVVGIVSRLEHGGFVVCSQCKDNRNKNVELTQKARDIDVDMRNNAQQTEQKLLAPLSESEQNELKRLLTLVLENFD